MHGPAPARPVAIALLATLFVLLGPRIASAQPEDPGNAATWYLRAITEGSGIDERHQRVVSDWDRRTPPTRALRAALRAHAPILDLVERGTDCRWCDFQVNYDAGWELLLPHLGQLRQLQRALAARSAVAIFEGRGRAATADIERIHRIAYHVAGDDLIISSLVALAGTRLAEELVDMGFRRGVFGPQEAADLLGITKELAAPDAFRLRNAVAMERQINSVWLRDRLVNGTIDDRVELMSMLGMNDIGEEDAQRLRDTPTDAVIEQLDLLDASYAVIDESFAIMHSDPEEAVESFEALREELLEGAYGELAMAVVPAFGKVLATGIQTQEHLARRQEMLEAIIRGDAGAVRLDGAVHLREAIARAAAVPDELADLVALGGSIPPVDEDAIAAAEAWESALEQVRAAAMAGGFESDVLRVEGDSMIVPAWAAGARRVMRMLAGTVVERRDAGQLDEAARLAALGVRLVAHLSGTNSPVISRIAQEHLEQLVPVIASLPAERRRTTLRAVGELIVVNAATEGQSVPSPGRAAERLGYPAIEAALTTYGSQAVADLRAHLQGAEPQWAGDDVDVARLDLDQCVILMLVTERVAGAVYGPLAPPREVAPQPAGEPGPDGDDQITDATDALPAVTGLEGILDAAAMRTLEARVPELRRRLASGEESVGAVIGTEPSPLDLRPHTRTAGELIRALHRAIDPEHRWSAGAADDVAAGVAGGG